MSNDHGDLNSWTHHGEEGEGTSDEECSDDGSSYWGDGDDCSMEYGADVETMPELEGAHELTPSNAPAQHNFASEVSTSGLAAHEEPSQQVQLPPPGPSQYDYQFPPLPQPPPSGASNPQSAAHAAAQYNNSWPDFSLPSQTYLLEDIVSAGVPPGTATIAPPDSPPLGLATLTPASGQHNDQYQVVFEIISNVDSISASPSAAPVPPLAPGQQSSSDGQLPSLFQGLPLPIGTSFSVIASIIHSPEMGPFMVIPPTMITATGLQQLDPSTVLSEDFAVLFSVTEQVGAPSLSISENVALVLSNLGSTFPSFAQNFGNRRRHPRCRSNFDPIRYVDGLDTVNIFEIPNDANKCPHCWLPFGVTDEDDPDYKPDVPDNQEIADALAAFAALPADETKMNNDPVRTPCGHIFGRTCLIDSLRLVGTVCPMCRAELNTEGKGAGALGRGS